MTERSLRGGIDRFYREAVANLNRLTEKTGARLVVSSTWRHMPNVNALLRAAGVTVDLMGRTGADLESRGAEIAAWLGAFNTIGTAPFVILDDDDDMGDLSDRLVRTGFEEGLTTAHVDQAIAILANQSKSDAGRHIRSAENP